MSAATRLTRDGACLENTCGPEPFIDARAFLGGVFDFFQNVLCYRVNLFAGFRRLQVCIVAILCICPLLAHAVKVEVQISGIREATGSLWIALMKTPEAFEAGEPTLSRIVPVEASQLRVVFDDVEPGGEYALCVYHDIDGDGVLDKGFFGNPVEPYGFSNNARRVFSMPDFEEAAFTIPVSPDDYAVQIVQIR